MQNLIQFLPYYDLIKEEQTKNIENIKNGLYICLALKDIPNGILFWCHELSNLISLGYKLTNKEREFFTKILFKVIKIPNISESVVANCCSLMDSLINKKKYELDLEIDWWILYKILKKNYFAQNRKPCSPTFQNHGVYVVRFVKSSIRYFSSNAEKEIWEELSPGLFLHGTNLFETTYFLNLFLPTWNLKKVPIWFDQLISVWNWIGKNLFYILKTTQ
eukprot:Anaeramoba_flamelloidesc29035_g1_i2.p1 GENE.c29035_g1_i2~~c29035_g1_i2.p1  ORF type:complete len:219 (-),score=29.15 c29035_g1_i2:46-702(-)